VPEAYLPQRYLPDALEGSTFYEPGTFGFEREIAKRMAWWRDLRDRARDSLTAQSDRHESEDTT
jgi:putative ATPase